MTELEKFEAGVISTEMTQILSWAEAEIGLAGVQFYPYGTPPYRIDIEIPSGVEGSISISTNEYGLIEAHLSFGVGRWTYPIQSVLTFYED